MSEPHTLQDLEPELRRVGVDAGEALRLFANRNAPFERPIAPGEPVNIELSLSELQHILRSLPDGAGTQRFVDAWAARGRLWWRDGPGTHGTAP
jgi:hypothetical protein